MSQLLSGQVALITGGSRGIGEAMVRRFVEEGARVAFTYRSSSKRADEIVAELNKSGGDVKAYASDASSFEDAGKLITQVLEDFGSLDTLVNNAGITKDNLILRMGEQDWDDVINTNLKSVFNLTKHAIRPMLKARKGSIINLSSIVGDVGQAGQSNYAASKAGIVGFTKSIAKELGSRNIRCNAIAPGFIETEMTEVLPEETRKNYLANIPLNRMGTGQEVADVAVFLSSDRSAYVSGQSISVCGALNT